MDSSRIPNPVDASSTGVYPPTVQLDITAVAEREHITLLHCDTDYDLVAEVTSLQMLWVVPRGTVP
jgi:hypothetical protein